MNAQTKSLGVCRNEKKQAQFRSREWIGFQWRVRGEDMSQGLSILIQCPRRDTAERRKQDKVVLEGSSEIDLTVTNLGDGEGFLW
jgi:hypothetical protein